MLIANISLLWKTILMYIGFGFFNILFLGLSIQFHYHSNYLPVLIWIGGNIFLCVYLCYIALGLNRLLRSGEKLAEGNFGYKTDTSKLFGELRLHGEHLNSIGSGMAKAVNERMKSESFKTELITNVSHDIKTPLTSIINYVGLLKKEPTDNENIKQYTEVLSRQSARLKKLTDDIIEASKASTGSITVNMEVADASELLRQALGEYASRFEEAGLEPVIDAAEPGAQIQADGKLMWRVFDNLLGNICKYSLPGTRVYISVREGAGKLELTFKNISKYALNITGDELTERFVRGDISRSEDGSGLGLSIAKSLVELQKGIMKIDIDGDLFKVTVTFNAV